jgi:Na+/glutamate symporter
LLLTFNGYAGPVAVVVVVGTVVVVVFVVVVVVLVVVLGRVWRAACANGRPVALSATANPAIASTPTANSRTDFRLTEFAA